MIGQLFVVYWVGALCALQLQIVIIRENPTAIPGGGFAAVAVTAMLWPLVLVMIVVGLLLNGIDEL